MLIYAYDLECLNPCCNGRCTRTSQVSVMVSVIVVLILVVMEDALALARNNLKIYTMDSLNPCCNGRCTRTEDPKALKAKDSGS